MTAAAHHFAAAGEVRHLAVVIRKYPAVLKACLGHNGHPKNAFDAYSLLHRAVAHGHGEVVTLLLDSGANIEGDGGEGWTPLHVAAKADQPEMLKLLVSRGAKLEAKTIAQPARPLPGGMGNGRVEWSTPVPALSALDIARRVRATRSIEYLESELAKQKK